VCTAYFSPRKNCHFYDHVQKVCNTVVWKTALNEHNLKNNHPYWNQEIFKAWLGKVVSLSMQFLFFIKTTFLLCSVPVIESVCVQILKTLVLLRNSETYCLLVWRLKKEKAWCMFSIQTRTKLWKLLKYLMEWVAHSAKIKLQRFENIIVLGHLIQRLLMWSRWTTTVVHREFIVAKTCIHFTKM